MKNPKRYELSFNPDKLGEQWDNPCNDFLQGLENTEAKPEAESNSHLAEFSIGKCFEVFQWEVFLIFYSPLRCYAYRGVKADFLEIQRNLTLLGIGMPSFIVLLHQPPCPAKKLL